MKIKDNGESRQTAGCAEKGQTVIAVTHELDLAAQAHRRIKLVDGKIAEDSG